MGLLVVRRDKRDRTLGSEILYEDIGARVSIHVAPDRQSEVVEHGGCDIHDGAALQAGVLDVGAVGEHEGASGATNNHIHYRLRT